MDQRVCPCGCGRLVSSTKQDMATIATASVSASHALVNGWEGSSAGWAARDLLGFIDTGDRLRGQLVAGIHGTAEPDAGDVYRDWASWQDTASRLLESICNGPVTTDVGVAPDSVAPVESAQATDAIPLPMAIIIVQFAGIWDEYVELRSEYDHLIGVAGALYQAFEGDERQLVEDYMTGKLSHLYDDMHRKRFSLYLSRTFEDLYDRAREEIAATAAALDADWRQHSPRDIVALAEHIATSPTWTARYRDAANDGAELTQQVMIDAALLALDTFAAQARTKIGRKVKWEQASTVFALLWNKAERVAIILGAHDQACWCAAAAEWGTKATVKLKNGDVQAAVLLDRERAKGDPMPPITELLLRVVSRPSNYAILSASVHGSRFGISDGVAVDNEGAHEIHGFGLPPRPNIKVACRAVEVPCYLLARWNGVDASGLRQRVDNVLCMVDTP